jgi:hypothetical protein
MEPRTAPAADDDRYGVGIGVGVDADDEIDHLTRIGRTGHAFTPSPAGDVVPVRDAGSGL